MLCRYPIYSAAMKGLHPCGRCFHCRVNKKLKRKSRLLLEGRQAHEGKVTFITLTYDDAHLPTSVYHPKNGEIYESEVGTLDPWELQKFFKRLRRNFFKRYGRQLRFAACGEYGEDNARPHYHLIIFGADKRELGPQGVNDFGPVYESWTDSRGNLKCSPERLDIQVPNSEEHISGYISDYIIKGSFEDRQRRSGSKYPEFFRSSQGLGRDAVEGLAAAMRSPSAFESIWAYGAIPHTFEMNGKNYLLDRYMRDKILTHFGPALAEELQKQGVARYDQEMYELRQKAEANQKFSRSQDRLCAEFVAQNAQAMNVREAKYARFNPTKKGL